jgi:F0F1-type ATP synthase delta subunit
MSKIQYQDFLTSHIKNSMNKSLLKELIIASYKNGKLDQAKILSIADQLKRKELKAYIHAIKQAEKKRTVYIEMAEDSTKEQSEELQALFPNKRIVINKNPTLITGMRIQNNDDVFEMNLKHELDAIIEQVQND